MKEPKRKVEDSSNIPYVWDVKYGHHYWSDFRVVFFIMYCTEQIYQKWFQWIFDSTKLNAIIHWILNASASQFCHCLLLNIAIDSFTFWIGHLMCRRANREQLNSWAEAKPKKWQHHFYNEYAITYPFIIRLIKIHQLFSSTNGTDQIWIQYSQTINIFDLQMDNIVLSRKLDFIVMLFNEISFFATKSDFTSPTKPFSTLTAKCCSYSPLNHTQLIRTNYAILTGIGTFFLTFSLAKFKLNSLANRCSAKWEMLTWLT